MLKPEDYWDLEGTLMKRKEKNRIAKWIIFFSLFFTVGVTIIYWDKVGISPVIFWCLGVMFSVANDARVETEKDLSIISGKIKEMGRRIEADDFWKTRRIRQEEAEEKTGGLGKGR